MAETDRVVEALQDPGFYPHGPERVELEETHISYVFVAGDRVYKLKKPVVLPFLDYGTLERRREMCREEVRLNRRLAPDAYLGVHAVIEEEGRMRLGDDGDAGAVEYLVEMRRLPLQRSLARLIDSGELAPAHIDAVARRLAEFHASAAAAERSHGSPAAIKRTYDETFETLLSLGADVAAAARFADAFVSAHRDLLEQRMAAGHVRDGHGDLRAEHVVVDDRVQVFDCVEFDPALRRADVAADLSFLTMDLERAGAPDAASALVEAYRAAGGDPGPAALLAFYAAQHAWVRAKVALLRAGQEDAGAEREQRAAAELAALAGRLQWRARMPLAVVVCGPAASGKSTLAEALEERSGLARFSSDVVRKRLAGIAPNKRGGEQLYTPEIDRRVYDELGALAAAAGGAIVDATCRTREYRERVVAPLRDAGVPPLLVECRAPRAVLLERAERRERSGASTSDAGAAVAEHQLDTFEPLDEVPPGEHMLLRSDRPAAELAEEVEATLDARAIRP